MVFKIMKNPNSTPWLLIRIFMGISITVFLYFTIKDTALYNRMYTTISSFITGEPPSPCALPSYKFVRE